MGPPNFFDMAVCNAAGALHHLTFLDEAKLQVMVLHTCAAAVTWPWWAQLPPIPK